MLVLGNSKPDLNYAFFLFSATLFLYCFHRIYRSEVRSAEEKYSARHLWIRNHPVLFYSILLSSALATLLSAMLFVSFHILLCLLPVALISIGYTIPLLPWKGKKIRFRDIPGIKVLLIALVLGLTTVLLPVLASSDPHVLLSPSIILVFFRRMFFIFAITVPFDIRDLDYDQRNNTKTLPVLFGVRKAKAIAIFALAAFGLLTIFQYLVMKNTTIAYVTALLLSAVVSGWMIMISGKRRKDVFYSVCLEGMMMLQCLLVMAASIFSL